MQLIKLVDLYAQEKVLASQTVDKFHSVTRVFIQDTKKMTVFFNRNTVIKWRNQLLLRVAGTTCNTYLRHMQILLNFAVKVGSVETNPFTDVSKVKIKKTKEKTLKKENINKLIVFLKTDYYYSKNGWFYLAIIDTLGLTGIRRRQLIGIKWLDINLIKKTIYLDAEFSKNGRANLIPINNKLIDHFQNLKQFTYQQESDQVFNITKIVNRYKGTEMKEAHVSSLFAKWSKKIGIRLGCHRFRHTVATKGANSGINLKTVQQLLGHVDIKTTLGYVETNINDLRKLQDML